jgi:hypothetical protein
MGSGYEIARAIQQCVRNGHDVRDCWNYTPRQLAAWVDLIGRDDRSEILKIATAFNIAQSSGNPKTKKMIDKIEDQSR